MGFPMTSSRVLQLDPSYPHSTVVNLKETLKNNYYTEMIRRRCVGFRINKQIPAAKLFILDNKRDICIYTLPQHLSRNYIQMSTFQG